MSGLIIRWMKENKRIGDNVSSEFVEIELNADTLTESPDRLPSLIKDLMAELTAEKTAENTVESRVFSSMNSSENGHRRSSAEV